MASGCRVKFGPVPPEEAEGAILAHGVKRPGLSFAKGRVLSSNDIAALQAAGVETVMVAQPEEGDISEDEAAARIAKAVAGAHVRVDKAFTGRANLFAEKAGVTLVDRSRIDVLNRLDEAITFATLDEFAPVVAGTMIATVKIVPYAVAADVVQKAAALGPLVSVAPYHVRQVALINTLSPSLAEKVVDKTLRVTAQRIAKAGARITQDLRVAHEAGALEEAIRQVQSADLIVIFGASAIADRRDVIPSALVAAGGTVAHLGMPVDPGNLLMLGSLTGVPVLGAPGCARSPRENGFDWVLDRLLAGLEVTGHDMTGMGVGGLLMEIVARPQPREGGETTGETHAVSALVLAAGRSTRMGGPNKLLSDLDGKPMVRHAVEAALASRVAEVVVVTGHQEAEVRAALAGLTVRFVQNPAYAEGLSTSLATGLAALGEEADAAIVLLGDMPYVDAALIDALIAAYDPVSDAHIVVPVFEGRRGNPVLWGRRLFAELARVSGDQGGRLVLAAHQDLVCEVAVTTQDTLVDLDTPEALAQARKGAPVVSDQ